MKQGILFDEDIEYVNLTSFQNAIRESYSISAKQDKKSKEKSPEKIKPIHKYLSNKVLDYTNDLGTDGHGYGVDEKEKEVNGKRRDFYLIVFGEEGGIIFEYKANLTSINKNIGTALNEMFGDSFLAKETGYPYIRCLLLPSASPILTDEGKIKGFESNKKYVKDISDKMQKENFYKPDLICIYFYEISNINTEEWIGKSKKEFFEYVSTNGEINLPIFSEDNKANNVIINDEEKFLERVKEISAPKNLRETQRKAKLLEKVTIMNSMEIEKLLKL